MWEQLHLRGHLQDAEYCRAASRSIEQQGSKRVGTIEARQEEEITSGKIQTPQ